MAQLTIPALGLIRFGSFELDTAAGELRKHALRLRLEGHPIQILAILLERPGEVVTREELRGRLWPADTFVDFEHGINTAVKRLRHALDDSAETPRFIQTLPRRGYRFIYPLNGAAVEPPPRPAAVPQSWRSRRLRLLAALVLLALLSVSVVVAWSAFQRRSLAAQQPARQVKSLAVLPLQNLSGDPGQEYLADGVTEELITDLSRVAGLKVIARTSVMQYKNTSKTTSDIGRELDVEALVEGSVVREGNHVRVIVQLVDARSGAHLWAERYERDVTSAIALQRDIAREITQEMSLEPVRSNATRSHAVDPVAYELYLKGRYLQGKWSTPENVRAAIALYDQAITKDPQFAAAHAARGLAYLYLGSALIEAGPHPDDIPQARASAQRALELDPGSAEGFETLGWLAETHDFDWDAAERADRKAMELNPSYAPPYMLLAQVLNVRGRHAQALLFALRAHELDPLSAHVQWSLGEAYLFAGDTDKAIKTCQDGVALNPEFWPFYTLLGNVYEKLGAYDRAIESLQRAVEVSHRHPYALGALGSAYALSGRRDLALQVLAELRRRSRTAYVAPPIMVRLYASLGDNDRAFAWLEKAYEQRSAEAPRVLLWGAALGTMASDPRLPSLLKRMNVPLNPAG